MGGLPCSVAAIFADFSCDVQKMDSAPDGLLINFWVERSVGSHAPTHLQANRDGL